jgi:hypothetical protein
MAEIGEKREAGNCFYNASSHAKMDASVRHNAVPSFAVMIDRLRHFDGFSLHLEICRGITVGGGCTGMP